jgi:hypothetical protein
MAHPQPPPDPVEAIRRLYHETTAARVQKDLQRAIVLFKLLTTERQREQAAVYMDGLSQMRSEWAAQQRPPTAKRPRAPKPRR